MARTGLVPADDRAHGYQVDPYAGTARRSRFTLNATAPLGGLWSTVADMARYAAYLADPDDRVVSPETIDEMCRPLIMTDVDGWTGAYGLGFGMGRRVTGSSSVTAERCPAISPGCGSGAGTRSARSSSPTRRRSRAARAGDGPGRGRGRCGAADRAGLGAGAARPELAELLGQWWSEGSPITFFVRDGELWSRLTEDPLGDAVRAGGARPLSGRRREGAWRGPPGRACG